MVKDLPAVTGNDRAVCTDEGFLIAPRTVTQKDSKNAFDAAAAERFLVENIPVEERTKDQLEFDRRKFNNMTATVVQTWRNAARGDKTDRQFAFDRTVGKVEERSVSINASISLDDYLDKPELNNATAEELEEAGINMVDVIVVDEENYAADL